MKNINQNEVVTKEVRKALITGVKSVSRTLLAIVFLTGLALVITSSLGVANSYTLLILIAGFIASVVVTIQMFVNFYKALDDKNPKEKVGFKAKVLIRK